MKRPILKILLFILLAGLMELLPQASHAQFTLYIGDGAFITMNRTYKKAIYLVVNDDRSSAIATQNFNATGWIISEHDSCFVKWLCGISSSDWQYTVPFGDSTLTNYLPFSFTAASAGDLADVSVATWGTEDTLPATFKNRNNEPWPRDVPRPHADPYERMVTDVIDRWWRVRWEGPTSNGGWPQLSMIDFWYQGLENTLLAPQIDFVAPQCWDVATYEWTVPFGLGIESDVVGTLSSNYFDGITIDPLSSIWVLTRVSHPLEVGLLFLDAQCDGNNVTVDWSTASETNNESFTVQRSTDGSNYTDLGVLAGAGNSNTVQNYHFVDFHPPGGMAYYRLKQKDTYGMITYSAIVQAGNCSGSEDAFVQVFAFYDPKDQTVSVAMNGYSGPATVVLHDMTGRQLTERAMTELNSVKLNVAFIRTGVYFVVVRTEFKTISTKLLISRQQ